MTEDPPKLRQARIVTPPNYIKQKIGTGPIDPAALARAEKAIENNTIDFKPIAEALLAELDAAIKRLRESSAQTEAQMEEILYPAAQFKAQGALFHFPIVSDIADILINFLESVPLPLDPAAFEIFNAGKLSITVVLHTGLRDKKDPQGAALVQSLADACARYFQAVNH